MSSKSPHVNRASTNVERQDETSSSDFEWKSDDELEAKVRDEFSIIYNWAKERRDIDPKIVEDIIKDLNDVKIWHRQYLESEPKNKDALDKAFNLVTTARMKMNNAIPLDLKARATWLTGLLGGNIYAGGGWLLFHFLFAWLWPSSVFIVDLVFVAIVGAIASAALTLGKRASRISSIELISRIAASPALAVVLVILLSELTIGINLQSSVTTTASEIGAFTLKDASDVTKLAFGFLFAFFSETTIQLLKQVLPSTEK